MKKYMYVLLLLNSLIAFADERAVSISANYGNDAITVSDIAAIQQVVADAISEGVIDTMLTHQAKPASQSKFFMCVEAASDASAEQFGLFVNNLHRVQLSSGVRYQLKTTEKCAKNNALACIANPLSCFSQRFINSGAYSDYVSKAQFAAALDDISVGKTLMNLRIIENVSFASIYPADVGLPERSANCDAITFDAQGSVGSISCTLKGIATIAYKNITLQRDALGKWTCSTDVLQRYAGKCKGL
jgi:Tfp pilus assembly major pilin PilA